MFKVTIPRESKDQIYYVFGEKELTLYSTPVIMQAEDFKLHNCGIQQLGAYIQITNDEFEMLLELHKKQHNKFLNEVNKDLETVKKLTKTKMN